MKINKRVRRILLLLVACLLVWTVFPRPFSWLIPKRMVTDGRGIQAETEVTASFSFGMDEGAFHDLHREMEGIHFLAVPSTLLPVLHQPREPVQVKINYFHEGGAATSHCGTTLLWDGQILWVNFLGTHYLGYWPTSGESVDAAMQRLVEQYGS